MILLRRFAAELGKHRWRLLALAIGLLALARVVNYANSNNGMSPGGEAAMRLSMTYTWLTMRSPGEREAGLNKVYEAATNVTASSERAQIVSAEKVLLQECFRDVILPNFLFTFAYGRAEGFSRFLSRPDQFVAELKRRGSAFEILVVPPSEVSNLQSFVWAHRRNSQQVDYYGFPFMWAKRPEIYAGTRPGRDVRGGSTAMPTAQFDEYLRAALDWFHRKVALETIDQMLAQTGNVVVFDNGLASLRRIPDREAVLTRLEGLMTSTNTRAAHSATQILMVELKKNPDREVLLTRLEGLVTSTNRGVLYCVTDELGEFKNDRAVAAIGGLVERPDFSRMAVARALGKTGQADAVKYLERLLPAYRDRGNNANEIQLRLEIIAALARIPTPESRELLGKLEKDSLSSVSEAATAALKTVSPK